MAVLSLGRGYKPTRHNRRYDPQWAWLRQHAVGVWPMWDRHAKTLQNIARPGNWATINFGAGEEWRDMRYGPGLHFANNGYVDTGLKRIGGVGLFPGAGEKWTVVLRARIANNLQSTLLARAETSLANRQLWLQFNRPSASQHTPRLVLRGTGTNTNWGLDDDQWHLFWLTWDEVACTAYYDNAQGAIALPVGAGTENAGENILFGARGTSGPVDILDGDLDFVAILDVALTPAEITAWGRDIYAPWRPAPRRIPVPESGNSIYGSGLIGLNLGLTADGVTAISGSGLIPLDLSLFADGHNDAPPIEEVTMAELTAAIQAMVSGTYKRPRGLGEVLDTFSFSSPYAFETGDGPGLLNVGFRTAPGGLVIPASSSELVDLKGPMLDSIGDPFIPDTVRVFGLKAYPTNPSYLRIGGAAANPWQGWFDAVTGKERAQPDELVLRVEPGAGWPVVQGTGDILEIENPSAAAEARCDIIVLGSRTV